MKNCKNCGNEFKPDRKARMFCSRACSATHNNKNTPKRQQGPYSRERAECVRCGKVYLRKISSLFSFCSRECESKQLFENWLDGKEDFSKREWKTDFPRAIRLLLIESVGYQCQAIRSDTNERCTEKRFRPSGGSILEIEHIDGDATNHHVSNIMLLCPSCHSVTPTYRAGNWGKSTRTTRRVD